MECVICKNGSTAKGFETVSFEKEGHLIVIRKVPGEVCNNCGHFFVDEVVALEIEKKSKKAMEDGAEVEIFQYA